MAVSHGMQTLLRVGRNTRDLDRALAFHRDALGFRVDDARAPAPAWTHLPGVHASPTRTARLSLGAQLIELTEFPEAVPCRADGAACDLWFQHVAIVVGDMPAAYRRVAGSAAVAITRGGPQTLPPATGSVTAFKFRDPDGHPLELLGFPEGSGDPAWQSSQAAGPTLGIDHTAISVGDSDRSVAFYQLLGLHVATRGVNRGAEQQRLDDLAGVEVDVVALYAATRTPHLELLGYRRPPGRAATRGDVRAICADRQVWQADAIEALLDALAPAGFRDALVASGFIDGATVALLRDPDGHLAVLRGEGA